MADTLSASQNAALDSIDTHGVLTHGHWATLRYLNANGLIEPRDGINGIGPARPQIYRITEAGRIAAGENTLVHLLPAGLDTNAACGKKADAAATPLSGALTDVTCPRCTRLAPAAPRVVAVWRHAHDHPQWEHALTNHTFAQLADITTGARDAYEAALMAAVALGLDLPATPQEEPVR